LKRTRLNAPLQGRSFTVQAAIQFQRLISNFTTFNEKQDKQQAR
jgi:hypothetical protein